MTKDVIWTANLDEIWHCEVIRVNAHLGQLRVTRNNSPVPILDQQVGLSYGAQFGPDMDDVACWQDMCVEAVDEVEHDQSSS